jgi:hypothetical protein
MPIALLRAHIEMLNRQNAEDTIAAMNASAAGFGGVDDSVRRELEERARGGAPAKPREYASPMAIARRMGIPIKVGNK